MLSRLKQHGHNHPSYEAKYYGRARSVRSVRKLVDVLNQQHSNVSIIALLVHTVMEIVSVGLYVWTSQASHAQSVRAFKWQLSAFIIEVVLNIIFLLEWVALFFFEQDKKRYLVSLLSLVNAMTCVPMIVLGVGALVRTSWRYGWVPMYLRVWWISACLGVLLDYPQVAHLMVDVYRQITRYFIRLFAVTCTCIGTVQIVESCTGPYIDLYDTTYMMVVAFGTIGYGDVVVRSTPARLFMIVFLIIGISYFLPLFQQLSSISQRRWFYRTYRTRSWGLWRRKHVILCGLFTDMAVEVLLRSFYADWRKYLDVHIVLMSPQAHTAAVYLTANLPWFKDRVKLIVGDPCKPLDLHRAQAHHADAIFLYGNARSFAYYQDYTVIAQSMSVGAYDPNLPQHLLLRRSRTKRDVLPYAASVLELERTMHHLLGLSMVCPGAIPLLINLIRTYEPLPLDITLKRNWVDEYEYSLRNDLYTIPVPDALRQKSFHELSRDFFDKHVTLIGVLDVQGRVQLNPRGDVTDALKCIVIAKTRRMAEQATVAIAQESERVYGEEMLSVSRSSLFSSDVCLYATPQSHSPCHHHYRDNSKDDVQQEQQQQQLVDGSPTSAYGGGDEAATTRYTGDVRRRRHHRHGHYHYDNDDERALLQHEKKQQQQQQPWRGEKDDRAEANMYHGSGGGGNYDDVGGDPHGPMRSTAAAAGTVAGVSALLRIDDAFDYVNHFVIIDLAPAKTREKESRHSREAARMSIAHDMIHVMMPIRQTYPMSDIVLLTNDLSFAAYFEHHWARVQNVNPVKYIVGCGLNTADLRRCNLHECAGSCIFFAGDISAYGSTSAMSMLVVRSVHHLLQRTPSFPVVVELEGLTNLSFFPPYAEDHHLRKKAEVDYVFEPNFVIGNAVSRLMLYTSLQRNFFMKELTDIIDVFVSGHSPDSPALATMPLCECDVDFDIYEDVVNYALSHGFLPIALHRAITDLANPSINRQHFVLTNPPRVLAVNKSEDGLIYITPGPMPQHQSEHANS